MNKIKQAARTAHEVNKVYCEGLRDTSQPRWEDAPDWQRESAIHVAEAIVANPSQPAAQSHENWLKEKEDNGWKYGPVKDPEKKEHPCIVPFYQLPIEQQMKDIIFDAVVRGCMGIAK